METCGDILLSEMPATKDQRRMIATVLARLREPLGAGGEKKVVFNETSFSFTCCQVGSVGEGAGLLLSEGRRTA